MAWLQVTIAVPEEFIPDANQLAKVLGNGPEDEETFKLANWTDALGNFYSVSSGLVNSNFPIIATSPLVEPEWGADMDAANRAQAILDVYNPALNSSPFAVPFEICAVIGEDALAAIDIFGLAPLEASED